MYGVRHFPHLCLCLTVTAAGAGLSTACTFTTNKNKERACRCGTPSNSPPVPVPLRHLRWPPPGRPRQPWLDVERAGARLGHGSGGAGVLVRAYPAEEQGVVRGSKNCRRAGSRGLIAVSAGARLKRGRRGEGRHRGPRALRKGKGRTALLAGLASKCTGGRYAGAWGTRQRAEVATCERLPGARPGRGSQGGGGVGEGVPAEQQRAAAESAGARLKGAGEARGDNRGPRA